MLPLLSGLSDDAIRSLCRERLEALEHWLRRLIHDSLHPLGDYFSVVDAHGNFLIKRSIAIAALDRCKKEPIRYPRAVDAILLDEAVDIVCNPQLFSRFFRDSLSHAYPDGRDEARTFLKRVCVPRNNLAHANAISLRQAEQIICYSNDVIDSIRQHYIYLGMQQEYDVPLILKVTDSFGNQRQRSQLSVEGHGVALRLNNDPKFYLRPYDLLTVEIEVDPSYATANYELKWMIIPGFFITEEKSRKLSLQILPKHVAEQFQIMCSVITNRDWHRMGHSDDTLSLYYKVLPPISQQRAKA